MQFLTIANALLALASIAAAAPTPTTNSAATTTTPKPTPTFTCPKGWKAFLQTYESLPQDHGNHTHPVKTKSGTVGRLWYSESYWQVASPGVQTLADKFNHAKFNMTTHSGNITLSSVTTDTELAVISTYYGGEYFNVKSFWVRGQNQGAFTLSLKGYSYAAGDHSNYQIVTATFDVPDLPYGQFYQIRLSSAQMAQFTYLTEFQLGDASEDNPQVILLDDFSYCSYSDSQP